MVASCISDTPPVAPLLRSIGLTLGRVGREDAVVRDADLALVPGECLLLTGPTGAGKSTLLRALAGLRDVEVRGGHIERSAPATLLLQDVETQLLCTTVGEEVALGLRARGVPPAQAAVRVRSALGAVALVGCEGCETDALSQGEKQRVVLAALIALEPRVLLLDEPSSALDAQGRGALVRVLAERKRAGMALLVADHAPAELRTLVDRHLALEDGHLTERALPAAAFDLGELQRKGAGPTTTVVANADAPHLALHPGERVLVTGPNGPGKSTWLRAIAHEQSRTHLVALAIQQPRRSLFARTVASEIEFALRRHAVAEPARRARVDELLGRLDLTAFADASPLRLSFGQQHRLAMAAALAARPRVVLLDEPFAGVDPAGRRALLRWLADEQAESGAALVVASHDRQPLGAWCDQVVALPERHGPAGPAAAPSARPPPGPPLPARPLQSRPLQFREGRSLVHRRSAVTKMLAATGAGALALAVDSLPVLVALVGLVAVGYRVAGLSAKDFWRDGRWLLLQGATVLSLTLLLRGPTGWVDGCRTALQLALVFLPFGLVVRTTRTDALVEPLRRWLPARLAFAMGATLRFVPVFARELGELVEMQRLRGARLHPRELWRLQALQDWVSCIALPMAVRAIEVAHAAADAAEIRGVTGSEAQEDPP